VKPTVNSTSADNVEDMYFYRFSRRSFVANLDSMTFEAGGGICRGLQVARPHLAGQKGQGHTCS
jgi:hypothetical protein